jgi:hypothetical protein
VAVETQSRQHAGQLNSVQLNIVTIVDMKKAVATGTLKDALYMMDNSVGGQGQGTPQLETVCKQGQVLNWIIRPVDMDRRPDGTWPPMPRVNNIVFLDSEEGDEEGPAQTKICTGLGIYGMPDRIRSPLTPVYYYWAGMVLRDLPPGVYRYRMVLEMEQEEKKERLYMNTVESPSIRVHLL